MGMVENTKIINRIRGISTSDIDALAGFQINKNRRYTQLHPGKLEGRYLEVNLGGVQVFRENLTAGSFIESAPINSFIPFAAVLSNANDFKFCGKKIQTNAILQATGGSWDASFRDNLSFVAAAFDRESFRDAIGRLTGRDIPPEWLVSKAAITDPRALQRYAQGLDNIISSVSKNPYILTNKGVVHLLGESILRLLLDAISLTTPYAEKKSCQPNRLVGVRKVIDYSHHYRDQFLTISELCQVANLSERNLQYAFKEYLGVTPTRYLRLLRLNGARRELLCAQPRKDRVVDVALNWGFVELGRFAAEYRQIFQELPSITLNLATN
jgi:AraC family ethanolamine operon transcriptional activator